MDPRGSQQDDDIDVPGKTTMVDVIITGCHIYTELLQMSQSASSMNNFVNFCMLNLMSMHALRSDQFAYSSCFHLVACYFYGW